MLKKIEFDLVTLVMAQTRLHQGAKGVRAPHPQLTFKYLLYRSVGPPLVIGRGICYQTFLGIRSRMGAGLGGLG